MAEHCQHLSTNEREKLLNLLRKFEVTLGIWKTAPAELELKSDTNTIMFTALSFTDNTQDNI